MLRSLIRDGYVVYLLAFFVIIGLFTESVARALPSVSLFAMLGFVLLESDLKKRWQQFICRPEFALYLVLCLVFLLEYLRTDTLNMKYYFERLRLNGGFLAFPLIFGLSSAFKETRVYRLYYFFLVVTTLYALGVLVNYAFHFEEINESYMRSKILPIGINHVRFSLLVASAAVFGLFVSGKKVLFKYAWEQKLQYAMVGFCILFLHVLSVRIGLLALYTGVFFYVVYLIFKANKKKIGMAVLAAMIVVPVLAVLFVPTMQNKLKNTKNDLVAMQSTYNANFHSLTGRIVSYKVAFDIFKENEWFGVGTGNLEQAVLETYAEHFSEIRPSKRIFPHNQYLRYLAAEGVIGVLFFMSVLYFPLFVKRYRTHFLLWVHLVMLSLSMLFEGTLESQLGLNYGLLFLFLPLAFLKHVPGSTNKDC